MSWTPKCDVCDGEMTEDELQARFRRPSNSTELTCTMAFHRKCGESSGFKEMSAIQLQQLGDPSGAVASPKAWERYIESDTAREQGFLFLT